MYQMNIFAIREMRFANNAFVKTEFSAFLSYLLPYLMHLSLFVCVYSTYGLFLSLFYLRSF